MYTVVQLHRRTIGLLQAECSLIATILRSWCSYSACTINSCCILIEGLLQSYVTSLEVGLLLLYCGRTALAL